MSGSTRARVALVLLSIAVAAGPAAAQDESLERAREAFEKARGHFEKGEYQEAASEFERAYQARAFPPFLFNAGASYEKLKRYDEAVRFYTRFAGATDSDEEKVSAQKRIAALEKAPSPELETLGEPRIRGLVVIETEPRGATIRLGGEVLGETPWHGSLEGKRTVYLEKEGYEPSEHAIDSSGDRLIVVAVSMAEKVEAAPAAPAPEDRPVGYISVAGPDAHRNQVYLDGKVLCERGPCREPVDPGKHTIVVRREGRKSFERRVDLQARTELTVYPKLEKKPSRTDAIVAYALGAVFAGGGLLALDRARDIRDDLRADLAAGTPSVSQEDGRFLEARIWSIAGHATLGIGVVTGALAIYYTFRDKGPASTATVDVKAVAIEPQVGPGYAGVGVGAAF